MLEVLSRARDEFGVVAVKAEFEAEGTRVDELLRLLEIARKANVKVGLKIGGCEAIRDLIECRQYGADYIIAPMVESPYALSKFVAGKDNFYSSDEQEDVGFLFNVETRETFDRIEKLADVAAKGRVGMVFGRVDFAGSMGRARDFVNTEEMTDYVCSVAKLAQQHDLELVVGGGVSPDSIEPLRRIREVRLDRFETRKVIFDAAILDGGPVRQGMEAAIEFELLWLQNKRNYYRTIAAEDETRIAMMEARQNAKVA
ncbi:MAG: aldolase/citrate lyase family protein [Tsuneonella sp.]|jgi:hypothetical protein|uniref:aldolase/citrate lyase family protein n=1 Tax=Sphingomonas sp. TaxID=28214 RepID=UPI002E12F607|nr:aldolase/citrate lyase family protein [Sphingomonas sp.]HEV7287942.1 aldolase/citrate lyase family protein [Sphingomonas sp.]